MLVLAVAMDLYPDSASDSELDGCGNPDYDGDFETAGGDIGVASHCNCEQATSSSKASAVRRNCYSEKNSILERHARQLYTESTSESIKYESNGCVLGRLVGTDSPDSW